MKKHLFGILALSILLGSVACSKEDPTPETYSFNVDGTSKEYSSSITINDYQGTYGVTLEGAPSKASSNIEGIRITLPTEGTGTYTKETYNSMGSSVTRPNIRYVDKNGNIWTYFGSNYGTNDIGFTINISTYDASSGIVVGSFSGKLWASSSNGSSAPQSITITNGSFSHTGITIAQY